MEWDHSHSPRTKKFRSQLSAGRVMCSVFWDAQSIIVSNFVESEATVISKGYVKTFIKLKTGIARTRPEKKKTVFLPHENARPHASLKTTECVTKFGWTVLPYPPCSPDQAPSDFCLFGLTRKEFWEQYFIDNNAVIDAVKKSIATAENSFTSVAYRLRSSLEKCIEDGGD